ncbi:MAG: agmatine deiminase family protein [Pseudomonadota bacterium]
MPRPFLLILACVILLCLVIRLEGANAETGFSYPAEWEPHKSLWMGFRTHDEGLIHEPLLQHLIRILSPYVHINLVVEDPDLFVEQPVYFSMLDVDPSRVTVKILQPADFWFRDSGPFFLINSQKQTAIADFEFSNYQNTGLNNKSEKAKDLGRIDQTIAKQNHLIQIRSKVILEGGAFEVNGKGTILLSSLILRRNPDMAKADIEQEILRTLGQKKAIWLNQGLAQDPHGIQQITGNYWGRGTGGHVDEFVRFVNASTLLLAWTQDTHPINRINNERMTENYQILINATDQDGQSFTIIKVPLPDLEIQTITSHTGDVRHDVAAASYLNFLITNGLVLLPEYWTPGKPLSIKQKDDFIKQLMKHYFPNRDIRSVNPISLNRNGGGLHCIYQQEP